MARVISLGASLVALVLLNVSPAYAEATAIPEPATTLLLGTAAAAVGIRAYRNRTRR